MDLDIQFGELEQAKPEPCVRPDQNRHFAVVAVGSPEEGDMPIFVDLDVMREMEEHAGSDTRVELGGVMLGGQHQDQDGRPFVMVSDSLRAQHYESTKGSFKFTHDTWAQITRERDQFPADLRMVGWYHTHPNWGVFLSGMDLFICDHFFNRAQDIALVMDPCREERGFFQRSRDPPQRIRPTRGFHLIASRFRQPELQAYAAYVEGRCIMSADPRLRHDTQFGYPAPVIQIADSKPAWLSVAVLSSITIQVCFLALVAWQIMSQRASPLTESLQQQLAGLQQDVATMAQANRQQLELQAKIDILDQVVEQPQGNAGLKAGLTRLLTERTRELDELRANLRGQQSLERELEQRVTSLQTELEQSRQSGERLTQQVRQLQTSLANLGSQNESQRENIQALETKLADSQLPTAKDAEPLADNGSWRSTWGIVGGVLTVLALCGLGAGAFCWKRRHSDVDGVCED